MDNKVRESIILTICDDLDIHVNELCEFTYYHSTYVKDYYDSDRLIMRYPPLKLVLDFGLANEVRRKNDVTIHPYGSVESIRIYMDNSIEHWNKFVSEHYVKYTLINKIIELI